MRLTDSARALWARTRSLTPPAWLGPFGREPWIVLGPLILVQWLALIVFMVTVRHNSWLYYQGGDQTYYWTQAHLLSQWTLPVTAIGYGWSFLLTPIALFAGANVLSGLPAVLLLNALVLLPVALLCIYGIATRIGGRYLGYWAAFLWVLIPYAAIPMFDHRYHQKYVEITLPQQYGLTVLGDFPSMVLLLVTAYLLVRGLDSGDWRDTALAGLALAFVIGMKPSNALFLPAGVLALLVARRWLQTGAFLAAMIPGLFILALWKQRGLGELPAFSSYGGGHGGVAAAGVNVPFGSLTSPLKRYVDLNWGQLHKNLDGVREFFWAVRPLEFIVPAGFLAIGRRSWPKAVLIFVWFATYFVIKGTADEASIEDASFFRLLMPAFPAFLLLLACIPLLVPSFGLARRVFVPAPALRRRPGYRLLGGAAAVLVVLPLILVAGTSKQSTPIAVNYPAQDVYIPVKDFGLNAQHSGKREVLTWKAPYSGKTKVFYTVLRSRYKATDPTSDGQRQAVEGVACRPRDNGRSLPCYMFMDRLAPSRTLRYIDRPPKGKWTYRVAMSGNWIDDADLGDLLMVSKPVTVDVAKS